MRSVATDNLLRLGSSGSDFEGGGSVRLLDALFALGDTVRVKARAEEYVDAGADHVALQGGHRRPGRIRFATGRMA